MGSLQISLIVPANNSEKYLQTCVGGVLLQTFYTIELILIDDGSADDSGKICCEYASQDSRVIVIQTLPSGVSFARTAGLQAATGDLVMFVDSDDWLDLETVERCVSEFEKNPDLDCLLFTYIT